MILVDDRTGSKELVPYIVQRNVAAAAFRLESGDFQFIGNGPTGDVLVGVERKTIGDLIQCMHDGRYSGYQLPKFRAAYPGHGTCWLFVEGNYRCGDDGHVEVPIGFGRWGTPYGCRPVLFRSLDNFMSSSYVTHGVGVKEPHAAVPTGSMDVIRDYDKRDFATRLVNLYWWWQKAWDEHRSHKTLYTPPAPVAPGGGKVSLCRTWANSLPGIGWEKSAVVAAHFDDNARRMATATRTEWIIPKVVGPKISLNLVQLIGRGHKMTDEEREWLTMATVDKLKGPVE